MVAQQADTDIHAHMAACSHTHRLTWAACSNTHAHMDSTHRHT